MSNSSPYLLYGTSGEGLTNASRDIIDKKISDRNTGALFAESANITNKPYSEFLTSYSTRVHKSANNSASIDYNRWEVFYADTKNPISKFQFMDNNLK